jgi:hypothetical protein
MLFFLPKKPVFTPSQIERMSNILDNAGQGFFVVLILTPLVGGFDKFNPFIVVLGIINVVVCWIGSLLLAKGKENKT